MGGIGSGKTWIGAYDLCKRAQPECPYMVVAPTYPMLRDSTLQTFLEISRKLGYLKRFTETKMQATLGNGAKIMFRSGDDPDHLRGPNLLGVWMDEASQTKREAFDVMIGRLRYRGKQGWLSATFTPNGLSHWTYEVFGRGVGGAKLFHSRTDENPFLPDTFYDTVRHQYSGLRADQELGGLFVQLEGAEWPAEYLPESIFYDELPRDIPIRFWIAALDPSCGKNAKKGDYAAMVLAGVDSQLHVWVDDCWLDRKPVDQVEDMAVAWLARSQESESRRITGFIIETNNFQERVAANIIRKSPGAPIYPQISTENKEVRIRMALTPILSQHRIHFRDTPAMRAGVNQMREFPLGQHDDFPDALTLLTVLANKLLGNHRTTQPVRHRA